MPCNCGKRASLLTPDSRNVTRSYPPRNADGLIELAAHPDCTTPYSGAFKRATIFVVGHGTEHETLYRRADRTQALAAAKAGNLTFSVVAASDLCSDAAMDLFGA